MSTTTDTKTYACLMHVNLGQRWSTPENVFGGVLDTGFTGGALCSKRWLKEYEKYMIRTHNAKPFEREPATKQTFIFGSDQQRVSDLQAKIPVWVVNKWKYITCRVIPGNLELLLGNKVIVELDMAIRMATDTIRLGQGKWIKIPRSQSGHMILPLAPKEKECAPKKLSRRLRREARLVRESSNLVTGQIDPQDELNKKTLLKSTATCCDVGFERFRSGSNLKCSHISDGAGVNEKSSETKKNAMGQALGSREPEPRPNESFLEVARLTDPSYSMDEGEPSGSVGRERVSDSEKISKIEKICESLNQKLEEALINNADHKKTRPHRDIGFECHKTKI